MVFCINPDKHRELSRIISEISKILEEDNGVEALVMNSYLVHIPYSEMFMPSPLIDGINIKLIIVANDERRYVEEVLDSLRATCLEKLNYNILFSILGSGALSLDNRNLKILFNDGEVLFDKTGKTTTIKNLAFMDKNPDVIEYEPKLNIRRG